VRDNELLIAPGDADLFLQYTTDTLPGSSGSPAFNKDWEVVGLPPQRSSGNEERPDHDDPRNSVEQGHAGFGYPLDCERGVRVSVICKNLSAARVKTD